MKEKKNEHAKRMEVHNSWRFKLMVRCVHAIIKGLGNLRREYDFLREYRQERA